MRRSIRIGFMSACVAVLCVACVSSPWRAFGGVRDQLPIKVISGKVRVVATGFVESDRRNGDLSTWVPDHASARRMNDYNDLVPTPSMTPTIYEVSEKTAGESISYALRVHESVSVTVTALNGDAIIECSGIMYTLSGLNSTAGFSFVH